MVFTWCLQYKSSIHANLALASGTLLEPYGGNLFSEILKLFPTEMFKGTGLEMN